MNYLSLFSGIGGLDLGLDRAGMRCIGQVECDPFCRRVLAKHWPDVPRFEDVCKFKGDDLGIRPDLICGGFPCQDISNAGRRAGIEGERSGLWSEFHRIICELRPGWVFVENVSALIGRGLGTVLGDLAEIGYDAEWHCLPASVVNAPHLRDRIWIVAYPTCGGDGQGRNVSIRPRRQDETATDARRNGSRIPHTTCKQARPAFGSGSNGAATEAWATQSPRTRRSPRLLSDAQLPRLERAGLRGAIADCARWVPEPDVCRVADGVSGIVDRLAALGNAVVPQVAELIGRAILAAHARAESERAA